jgi:hypothetical protein
MIAEFAEDITEHSDWGMHEFNENFEQIRSYRDKFHPSWKIFGVKIIEIEEKKDD